MGHKAEYPFLFKENMDTYLESLDKYIYYKYGNINVNIMISGGSALIIGHTFRNCTFDIDAFVDSRFDIKDLIGRVSLDFNIPDDWLNEDFVKTISFSKNLLVKADFLKAYKCIRLYKVCDLDLICMKIIAFRDKDEADLIGLLEDCKYITQDILTENLIFLYGEDVTLRLSARAIAFVRYHVRRY